MVFSGTEAVPEETEHGGDVTNDGPWAIRFDTGTDSEGDGTGVTQVDAEDGTVEDLGDATPRRPDGELIRCKDTAPT